MSLLVGEESKQRREHSAEAANSERHRHLLHGGVTSRQQVRVDRELHAAVKTLSRAWEVHVYGPVGKVHPFYKMVEPFYKLVEPIYQMVENLPFYQMVAIL